MKITYYGHSCFLLSADAGTRILTDPFHGIGYCLPPVLADAVTVSHGHFDHNNVAAVGGTPAVIQSAGTYKVGGVFLSLYPSFHDDVHGAKRGKNLVTKFEIDGITVCHLGDIGEPYDEKLGKRLSPVDVLLIPVGGNYTIDASEAKEYVERLSPTVVIPMHYKTADCNIDIANEEGFLTALKDRKTEHIGCELELSGRPAEKKIVVMGRKQA